MNNASDDTSVADVLGAPRSLCAGTTKLDHLDLLLRSLDVLIFLEIGILYCCDNLSILLAIRAISQVLYVQPNHSRFGGLSLPPTLVANLVCLVTHIVHSQPEAAARSARGWIHGGLLVDFVGELGPISKWRLLTYDLLIAALQILMLVIGHERRGLSGEDKQSSSQDIEAEEAGVRKSEDGQDENAANEENEGIEMDRLLPSGSQETARTSARQPDDDYIAVINMRQTIVTLAKPSVIPPQVESTDIATDERTARMRALLGRLITNRIGSSS